MRLAGLAVVALLACLAFAEQWRGLTVEPEHRCTTYDRDEYPYPATIEREIVEAQGGVWSPYTLRRFDSIRETDIEHIVPLSEAHDSGMCARGLDAKRAFARDLRNLTLASPAVNRNRKGHRDPAEWMPEHNRCWYAVRWVEVKRKWQLSVDTAERDALAEVLLTCGGELRRPA